jgi:hypothetical protein
MLKRLHELAKPDPRYMPGSPVDDVIGQRIEDLHGMMEPLELLPSVPDEVPLAIRHGPKRTHLFLVLIPGTALISPL